MFTIQFTLKVFWLHDLLDADQHAGGDNKPFPEITEVFIF